MFFFAKENPIYNDSDINSLKKLNKNLKYSNPKIREIEVFPGKITIHIKCIKPKIGIVKKLNAAGFKLNNEEIMVYSDSDEIDIKSEFDYLNLDPQEIKSIGQQHALSFKHAASISFTDTERYKEVVDILDPKFAKTLTKKDYRKIRYNFLGINTNTIATLLKAYDNIFTDCISLEITNNPLVDKYGNLISHDSLSSLNAMALNQGKTTFAFPTNRQLVKHKDFTSARLLQIAFALIITRTIKLFGKDLFIKKIKGSKEEDNLKEILAHIIKDISTSLDKKNKKKVDDFLTYILFPLECHDIRYLNFIKRVEESVRKCKTLTVIRMKIINYQDNNSSNNSKKLRLKI